MFKSHPSARWLIGLLDGRKRTPFDMIDVMNEKSAPGCQVSFKGRPRLQEMFCGDLGGDDDNNDDSRGHRQRAGRGGAVLQQLGGRGGKDCPPHLSSLPSDILQVKRSVPAERLLVHSAKQVSLGSLTTSYERDQPVSPRVLSLVVKRDKRFSSLFVQKWCFSYLDKYFSKLIFASIFLFGANFQNLFRIY